MAIIFTPFPFSVRTWIYLGLGVFITLFLVIGSYKLEEDKRNFELSKYILILSSLIFSYSIVRIFLPKETIVGDWIWEDLQTGFIYDFTINQTVPKGFLILLATALILFGLKNRKNNGKYFIVTGSILFLSNFLSLYNNAKYYYIAWFSNQDIGYILDKYVRLEIISVSLLIISFLSLAISGFRIKNYYLTTYSILIFALTLYKLLDFAVF